jgi:hypothetical protein
MAADGSIFKISAGSHGSDRRGARPKQGCRLSRGEPSIHTRSILASGCLNFLGFLRSGSTKLSKFAVILAYVDQIATTSPGAEFGSEARKRSEVRQRTELVAVRLLPREREALSTAARNRNVSLSELLRSCALKAVEA